MRILGQSSRPARVVKTPPNHPSRRPTVPTRDVQSRPNSSPHTHARSRAQRRRSPRPRGRASRDPRARGPDRVPRARPRPPTRRRTTAHPRAPPHTRAKRSTSSHSNAHVPFLEPTRAKPPDHARDIARSYRLRRSRSRDRSFARRPRPSVPSSRARDERETNASHAPWRERSWRASVCGALVARYRARSTREDTPGADPRMGMGVECPVMRTEAIARPSGRTRRVGVGGGIVVTRRIARHRVAGGWNRSDASNRPSSRGWRGGIVVTRRIARHRVGGIVARWARDDG